MILFYAPGTCAVACWISLKWAEADFNVVKVDPSSEGFQRVNPLMTVPVLNTEAGPILKQANTILYYIADRYPEALLGSEDSIIDHAQFNEIMSFLTSDFHPSFWPVFSPHRFTTSESPQALDNVISAAYTRIDRLMCHLNRLIDDKGYLYQGRRSVADAYAYVMIRWTKKLPKTWREYPNIARLYTRMEGDQVVKNIIRLSTNQR